VRSAGGDDCFFRRAAVARAPLLPVWRRTCRVDRREAGAYFDSAEAIRRVCATGDQGAHAEQSDGETLLPPGGRACPGIPVSRDLTPGEGTGYGVREMGAQLRAP